MKKRIYLIKHAYVPNWVYVGATKSKKLCNSLGCKWRKRHLSCTKVLKALRCSDRSDWSIEQLHDFTEDWQRLEAEYIAKYDSFHNGLNSTPSGAAENTLRQRNAAKANAKSVVCDNTIIFQSAQQAFEITGVHWKYISACCRNKQQAAGGYTWRFV